MNDRPSFHKETAVFCLVLIAAVLLFWWRVWIPDPGDRMHFTDDIYIKDYATRIGLFTIALSGYLPLWDPYQFGGWTGIANCEAGFFYPPNWVIVPFLSDPQSAFLAAEMLVLLHFVFAGLGAYRLSRSIGLSVYGAAFAGFALTFCGFHCAHKKHTNMMFALVWIPWILLSIENWLRQHRPRHLIIATFMQALAYVSGHPQSALYMTLLVMARFLYEGWSQRKTTALSHRILTVLPVFAVIGLAFGLSAIQWFPTAELIGESARANANQYQLSTEFSLPPQELIDAVLPEAVAPWYQTEVFYWGITPLFLTLMCLVFPVSIPLIRFLLLTGLFSVFLAMGEYFFVYDLTYLLIPGSAWVRAPSRWMYLASLPIAVTAGYIIDQLKSYNPKAWVPSFWICWGVWALAVLIWIVLKPAQLGGTDSIHYAMQKSSVFLIVFSGLFIAAFHGFSYQRLSHRAFAVVLLLLTWTDLATHYHRLDLAPGIGGYEVLDELEPVLSGPHRTKVFLRDGGNRTVYHGAAQGFRELDGQSPLTPRIHLEIRSDTAVPFPSKPNEALLRLFHVKNLILDQEGLPSSFEQYAGHLYTLPGESERTRILPEVFHVITGAQRDLLSIQSFPYGRVALMDQSKTMRDDRFPPSMMTPYISKPFLLVSASANAVRSGAYLVIEGKNHFENLQHDTGYVVAVIDPFTAQVEAVRSFDLPATEPSESLAEADYYREQSRMLDFIESIPVGKTVMAVVQDNGANNLGIQGVQALHQIGCLSDLRRAPLRTAHLIIGKKGAPMGSAIEITSPTEAFVLQTGQSLYTHGVFTGTPQGWHLHSTIHNTQDLPRFYQKTFPQQAALNGVQPYSRIEDRIVPVPVLVYSAPKKRNPISPDQAIVQIDGKDYSLNRTGYNIVVADPATFAVKDATNFNLLEDFPLLLDRSLTEEDRWLTNKAMQSYLKNVRDGDLIFGAIRDEAADLMHIDTLKLLKSYGSTFNAPVDTADAELRKRFSHAFFMIKGASFCVEAYGQDTDAILYTRYPGGPRLLETDLTIGSQVYQPFEAYHEIMTEVNRDPGLPKSPKGKAWLIEERGPNELIIKGESDGGILFVSEVYYPGWKVYVDAIEAPLHRLNYYFRGVEIEPGFHEIRMVYAPESFYTGAIVSLFSIVIVCAWILRIRHATSVGA